MNRIVAATVLVALGLSLPACGDGTRERRQMDLETLAAKTGYAVGLDVGASLRPPGQDVDMDAFMQGVEDGFLDREPLLAPDEATEARTAFFRRIEEDRARALKELADRNLAEGEAFLEQNATKDGVQTTESGLQYTVVEEGDGPQPQPADQVTLHYRGMLLDGTEFVNSYARGMPATMAAVRVIPGLAEALLLMRVGGKYRLFIPAHLAYGEMSPGPQIGPNSTLVFEVELLGVSEAEEAEDTGEAEPEGEPQTE